MTLNKKKLVIATTVADTLMLFKGQLRYLNKHFDLTLMTSPGKFVEQVIRNEGVSIVLVPMRRGISPFYDVHSIIIAIWHISKIKPDIVHSFTPKAGFIFMLASFLCSIDSRVHTFTGLIFPTATTIKRKLLMAMDSLICFLSTQVVAEGNGVAQDLKNNNITKKSLMVIGNGNIAGVDTYFFSKDNYEINITNSCLSEIVIPSNHFVFSFIGRVHRDKGLNELVKAFAKVSNSTLLIVGPDDENGPLDALTLDLIEGNPRIHKMGYVQDVRPILQASDCLVLPSYREGFPNVLLQAGAMSVPIIATNINGSNEIVVHGYNGWLVQPKNIDELCSTMLLASTCPRDILLEMGANSKNLIQEKFEQSLHWDRMRLFYGGLLK
jgi:glycosyltransferase involved in cell wall biosynthesis